ncbi:hypothetical protein Micbo1qcDRAFT_171038 [Microdochium bolleyi]|uniref:SnoaL-like domain-containing protein n=1 Tax=Microdochium bolleyi TaxID=196109 RepID=A0A136JJK3_9PEZI|nr:hypothetical protein Micbo1qcDRAFT_171038 [Microdochium bolleyi]
MGLAEAPSRRYQTALEVVEAYNSWDLSKIMAVRAPECLTQVLPKSLDRPELNNADYAKYLGTVMPAFSNFHVHVNEIIEDSRQNKVSIWAKSTADTIAGPYANEYVLIFHFNEAGDKLVRFYEFVDSKYSVDHFAKIHEVVQKRAKAAAAAGGAVKAQSSI